METGPLSLLVDATCGLRVLVDQSSVETFPNDGRYTNANLIFPTRPVRTSLCAQGDTAELLGLVDYDLHSEG